MNRNLPGWAWISLAGVCTIIIGFADWITGYELNFSVFYFAPVSLVAWFVGWGASVSLSVFAAVVWFGADTLSGHAHLSHFHAVWNTIVRLASFLIIGWSISKIRQFLDRERQLTEELRRLLSEVRVLESFLPICCLCKKIRNEEGRWQQMELYIAQHTGTYFSHGYCPESAKKVMEEAGLVDEQTEPFNKPDA